MLSYKDMLCLLEDQDPSTGSLMSSGEDSKSMRIIRSGMNLSQKDGDPTFWKDFMTLCGDADGVAELLDVKPSQVRRWTHKIQSVMNQIEKIDSMNPEGEDDKKVVPTGDGDNALTVDDFGMPNI